MTSKEKEDMLFKIVYETLKYFDVKAKSKRKKDIREFNEEVADLVMMKLINIL